MAKKAELKTKVNDASVEGFLNSVTDEQKRDDCFEILKLMSQRCGAQALSALEAITTKVPVDAKVTGC
jgi:hypothetical protein